MDREEEEATKEEATKEEATKEEATKEESKEEVEEEEEEWLRRVDTRLMTRASITCRSLGNGVSDPSDPSDTSTPPTIDPYDRLAQIDAYLSDLSTFHADLSLAVYRMELSQGAMESEGAKEHQARAAALRAKKRGGHGAGSHGHGRGGEGGAGAMEGVVERPPKYLSPVPSVESRLSRETNKNNYERCLRLIATCTRHRSKREERERLLDEALQCINTARSEEEVLLESLEGLESDGGGGGGGGGGGAGRSLIKHRATPLPPVFVSRSSTSITLRFDPFWTTPSTEKKDSSSSGGSMASRRKKTVPTVHHLRVYGKPRGAGTAVSLNNIEYGGLGDPVLVTSLGVCAEEPNQSSSTEGIDESGGGGGGGPGSPVRAAPPTFVAGYTTGATTLTVTGLLPNESYVFACAAFDEKGEVREIFFVFFFLVSFFFFFFSPVSR